jgi:hypothetical protein
VCVCVCEREREREKREYYDHIHAIHTTHTIAYMQCTPNIRTFPHC